MPEVPASQMVLTIITDEQLEAFADAVITKYQQNIVCHNAAEKPQEEWMTRKALACCPNVVQLNKNSPQRSLYGLLMCLGRGLKI